MNFGKRLARLFPWFVIFSRKFWGYLNENPQNVLAITWIRGLLLMHLFTIAVAFLIVLGGRFFNVEGEYRVLTSVIALTTSMVVVICSGIYGTVLIMNNVSRRQYTQVRNLLEENQRSGIVKVVRNSLAFANMHRSLRTATEVINTRIKHHRIPENRRDAYHDSVLDWHNGLEEALKSRAITVREVHGIDFQDEMSHIDHLRRNGELVGEHETKLLRHQEHFINFTIIKSLEGANRVKSEIWFGWGMWGKAPLKCFYSESIGLISDFEDRYEELFERIKT